MQGTSEVEGTQRFKYSAGYLEDLCLFSENAVKRLDHITYILFLDFKIKQ